MRALLLVVILLILLLAVVIAAAIRRRAAAIRAEDVTKELRIQMLRVTPQDLGLVATPGEPFVIVMDIGYPQAVASIVAAASGDASLYLSAGGGVIGGGQHENVRTAAIAFVREAGEHLVQLARTSEYPYPPTGSVRFYANTPEGTHFAEASEQELSSGAHPLSPLYIAGQNVITALRLITEERGASRRASS